ncbi:hypothetical protein E2P81_ATG02766 [Venturia nashicola]|nr:hypothetical protein E2P81_ATG02766 [Venturia nashicola]
MYTLGLCYFSELQGAGDGIVMQLWLADSMGKAEGRESADMIAEAARRYESMFVPRKLVGDTVYAYKKDVQ